MLTSVTVVKLDRLEIDVSELRLLANSQSSGCTSTIVVQSVKYSTYLSDYFVYLSI